MSEIKYVGGDALQKNIEKTKEYVDNHGGHKVINSSGTQMTARAGMQFSNMSVSDDSTNNKTVIRQTQVVATKAEWDAMTPDPNVTYYLPWMSNTEYAEDRTPIGTVISVTTAKTGEVTGITTPTGEFPSSDYLVCDGAVKNIADYPKLADWFSERYGSKNYFGGNGTTTFAVPDFTADFPTNGILAIKAQMSSTRVTYAEVDDSLTTSENVWSASKVSDEVDARIAENKTVAGLTPIFVSKTITLSANTNTSVDLSEFIPQGKIIRAIGTIKLGEYILPHFDTSSNTATLLEKIINNTLIVVNKASAWTNYTLTTIIYV